MDLQGGEPVNAQHTDGEVMTSAQRQAKRQEKLRSAFQQCELLQTDIKTVLVMLKSAVEGLKMISIDNDDAKSISIITHQIDNAIHLLNHDPKKHDKRKTDKTS
jgi:hypothetical protein